jgi:hypothetical protein
MLQHFISVKLARLEDIEMRYSICSNHSLRVSVHNWTLKMLPTGDTWFGEEALGVGTTWIV